jgi:ABC-type nitrate/sulfonate/bicarbonate transport system substrate-binding protein
MLLARNGNALAVVVTIGNRLYTVCTYADHAAFRASSPTATYSLVGSPNAADVLAVLPSGWAAEPGAPAGPSVPPTVTAWQIRRWLIANGYTLAQVSAIIDAIPNASEREAVRIDWEHAPYVERTHPMLEPMAAALGVDDLDAAFVQAERIK